MNKKQIIKVLKNTNLKDLKVGDIVITAELHKIVEIRNKNWISVVGIKPKSGAPYIKHIGYGQQGILKVVK